MPRIYVHLNEKTTQIEADGSLLDSLHKAEFDIDSICGGKGRCGKCVVHVMNGVCNPPTKSEIDLLGIQALSQGFRLACQVFPAGDLRARIFSRGVKKKILTFAKETKLRVDPRISARTVRIPPPSLADQAADSDRLMSICGATAIDPSILYKLPETIRRSNWEVDVIMFDQEIVDVLPSREAAPLGVAVDLGTTTIVLYLTDLRSGDLVSVEADYNMQIAHGEDVISRISYCTEDEGNLKELQELAVSTINKLVERATVGKQHAISQIYDLVVSGNTVMLNLLLRANPRYIASAPYAPPFLREQSIKARQVGLLSNEAAYLRTLPCIGGYIGADVVADVLASGMAEEEGPSMLIDVGTNAEVVLKWSGKMLTTSCAAGPAFEGGELSSGMRAVEGAIEEVMIDPKDFSVYYRTIEGIAPRGICGSGLVDSLAWMLLNGIVEKSGRMVAKDGARCVGVADGESALILARDEKRRPITVTQGDVRKGQLAKAAIYVGCETLIRKAGIAFSILAKIYLAGAFANYINPVSGMAIGMFPDVELTLFENVGNGSAAGSRMVLLSKEADVEAKRIAGQLQAIDMNLEKDFQERFVSATLFPHRDETLFRNVSQEIRRRGGIRPLPSELR